MTNKQLLADRMRPEHLSQYVGQQHIIGPGKLLRRAVESDMLRSLILFGPPGTGKTSLAHVISKMTDSRFVKLDATSAKTQDIRDVTKMAKDMLQGQDRKTIVFIDEIHRFKSNQQDTLLPAVEDGTIILIGATTENPYFEVNGALLSRSTIFKLEPLTEHEIKNALIVALDSKKGLEDYHATIKSDALDHIAKMANGDLRAAYNALELAVITTEPTSKSLEGKPLRVITLEIVEESIQKPVLRFSDSEYYDIMSAFSKSLRGGSSDGALHYFARMIEAGVDPKAIVRRLIIHASEDVGMANSTALLIAVAAFQALEVSGITEARIPIAHAIINLCESPKSNSVIMAVDRAFYDVKKKPLGDVPSHLRDAHYKGAKEFGNGDGYVYTHNIPGGWTPNQQYLPDNLVGSEYYKPSPNGGEAKILQTRKERLEKYNKLTGKQD